MQVNLQATRLTLTTRAKKALVTRAKKKALTIRQKCGVDYFMNIKTVLTLALSVVIADSMLLGTRAYADLPVESIQASIPPLQASAPDASPSTIPVSKHKRRMRMANNSKSVETYDPEIPDESTLVTSSNIKAPLQGSATYVDMSARFGDTIHQLTKSALEREPEYQKTAKAVDKYRTNFQRAMRFTKDAVNYAYPYRGFSMSMEGSKVVLDKNQKLTNLWIAELAKQRYWDEMHPKIMAQIMQIAMGLGMDKSEQADAAIQKGVEGLTKLVGKDTAESTLAELSEWKSQLSIPEPVFQQSAWDVEMTERIYQTAQKTSADGDPLINYVYKRVKKFDHGKLANFTASLVEANLAAATILSGNPLVSLAAEGASTAFVMSTGGPEENKILKELYFGRRLELRRKRISDETELALTNYEKGFLTHNGPQLAMSEVVLAELVGPERIATVLEHDPINDFTVAAPIELAKKDAK